MEAYELSSRGTVGATIMANLFYLAFGIDTQSLSLVDLVLVQGPEHNKYWGSMLRSSLRNDRLRTNYKGQQAEEIY